MDDEEGLVMPLYWSCQDLQNKLGQENVDRRDCIIKSIEENLEKFSKYSDKISFPSDMTWFNVDRPIDRSSLDGLITVLDFFTYCCINCMHILPDLEKLEALYPTGLSVVGVHSAKFENEKSEAQVEHAIHRYNIEHPICNDKSLSLWNNLGVTCWPTLLLLSPSGAPIHVFIGEGHTAFLFEFVQTAIKYFKDLGELKEGRIPRSIHGKAGGSSLKYPGKLALYKQYLAISDSGNNRVVIVDTNSCPMAVVLVAGSGDRGRKDGQATSASFNNPQGVCWVGENVLMIADTDNHLIRQINIKTKQVLTVGGTGSQGTDKEGGKLGIHQEISSPWDICKLNEDVVFIAMAGIHQIWMYCLDDVDWWKGAEYSAGTLVRVAGSGAEENRNNSYPAKVGFAQPSGLSVDLGFSPSGALYIADSESSTVRRLDLKDGAVKNVCGGERDPTNLFAFGDQEGAGINAKLQHPLAVAWNNARSELYIADSYNHKIKKVTGAKNETVSLLGTGEPGDILGDSKTARLCEPGGLCVSGDGDLLYIADTNNHSIKVLDLNTQTLSKLQLQFPGPKEVHDNIITHKIESGFGSGEVALTGNLKTPEYKLNPEGPSSWSIEFNPRDSWTGPEAGEIKSNLLSIQLNGSVSKPATLSLSLKLYLCNKSTGVCIARKVLHQIEIIPCEGASRVEKLDLGSLPIF